MSNPFAPPNSPSNPTGAPVPPPAQATVPLPGQTVPPTVPLPAQGTVPPPAPSTPTAPPQGAVPMQPGHAYPLPHGAVPPQPGLPYPTAYPPPAAHSPVPGAAPVPVATPGGPHAAPPRKGLSRTAVGLIAGSVCLVLGGGLGFAGGVASDAGAGIAAWFTDPVASDEWYDDGSGDAWSDEEWYGEEWEGSGTPDDPWFFDGLSIGGDEWDVWLDQPYEATAEILAHDDVNVAPPAGTEYWIVPVTATYFGPSSQVTAWGAVDVGYVDDDGTQVTDQCGAVPDALVGAGFIGTDDTVSGNVCLAVPAGAQGLWTLSIEHGEPTYIATDPALVG